MYYSERILTILEERGISPYRVSKETGISQSVFSNWKRKPTSRITAANLERLADYLGLPVEVLTGKSILRVKLVREGAVMPRRATAESAGLDLSAAIDAPVEIRQGEITPIPTGIAIQLDPGYVCLLFGRSGLGVKRGILPANAVGVVDSDYRGELMVHLTCIKDETYTVQPGERIAQMVILPVSMAEPVQVEELEESTRGTGGFGSTGK